MWKPTLKTNWYETCENQHFEYQMELIDPKFRKHAQVSWRWKID